MSLSLWISPRAPRLRNLRSRNSSSLDRTDSGAHHVILEPPLVFRQISARLSHAPVSAGGLLWVTARPNINVLSRSGSNQFDCPVNIRYLDASPWWYESEACTAGRTSTKLAKRVQKVASNQQPQKNMYKREGSEFAEEQHAMVV